MARIMKQFAPLIVISLLLFACSPKPPQISKDQFDLALKEAKEAEMNVKKLKTEKDNLIQELSKKDTELRNLKTYQQETGSN